jgi:glutamate synthase domain-containing protein 3
MSGGIAFVLDEEGRFRERCNVGMVDLEAVTTESDLETLRELIERHIRLTGSAKAERVLRDWASSLTRFVKVMPIDYRRSLLQLEEERRRLQAEAAPTVLEGGPAVEATSMFEPKRASA